MSYNPDQDIYSLDAHPKLMIERNFPAGDVWKVTSTSELKDDQLQALFAHGFIGYGQEMRVVKREATSETLPCTVVERWTNVIIGPHPKHTFQARRFIYTCYVTCDSSD